MGYSSGFRAGYSVVNDALLQRERDRQKSEFLAAQKEKEFERYTPERGAQMRAESEMVDAYGRPLYRYTIAPGSTQYTREELSYPEAAPAAASLTPEQETYLRNIEAAKDLSGRPYYSVDRGEGGLATVRARPVSAGGGFEYYDPSQAPMGRIRYLPEETAAYTEDGRPPAQVVITPEEIRAREAERAELLRQYGSTAEFRPTAGLAKQGGPSVGVPTGDAITYSPDVIEYLGKTYEQGLTPGKLSDKQKNAALMDKYAQILSAYDPVEGMKFKIMAEQERRAAEKAPLELQNLAQNIASGKIDLETKGFALEDIKKVRSLTEWMSTNPNATTKDIFAEADRLKLSTKARSEVIQQLTGITQGELDLAKTQITKEISGMSRKQLLQAYRDNPNITPGAHYEEVLDNKGNISLYLVDTATGKRLTSKPDFSGSAAEVDKYLRTAAVAPDTLLDFTINLRKSQADIFSKQASGQRDLAYADYLGDKGEAFLTGGLGRKGTERTEQDIVARLRENRETIKDIDAELEKLGSRKDEDSVKRREALIRQRNSLNQENEELRAYSRFDNSGGLAPQPKYKAGDVVSYVDESGKTVSARFKGGENKRENWEVITNTTDAASTTVKPPSGKGITEKEYESWIEDKLIGAFTSRTLQLRSIAKDHPNPQIRAAAQRMLEVEKNKPSPPGVDMPM